MHRGFKAFSIGTALVLAGAAWAQEDPEPELARVGEPAPRVVFKTSNGRVETAQGRFRSQALLLIFATPESSGEVLAIGPELRSLREAGLPVLLIDVDCFTSRQEAEDFWLDRRLSLSLGFDDGGLSSLYRVGGVPFAALIDSEGMLRYRGGLGNTQQDRTRFTQMVRRFHRARGELPAPLPVSGAGYSHLPNCRGVR